MKKIKVKPGQLPEWAKYAAKDNDKKVWIYEKKPVQYITGYNNADHFDRIEAVNLKIKGPLEKSLRKIKIVDDDFNKIYKKCCEKVAREIVRILTEV